MSLLFMDSFQSYGTTQMADRYFSSSNCSISTGTGPFTTPSIVPRTGNQMVVTTTYASMPYPCSRQTTIIQGAAFNMPAGSFSANITNTHTMFSMQDAVNGNSIWVYCDQNGVIGVYNSINNFFGLPTKLGNSLSAKMPQSAWVYVEWMVVCGTSGSVTVRVNGATVLALTGVNTAIGAVDMATLFGSGRNDGIAASDYYIFDTAGTNNTTFAGDCQVIACMPNAPGTNSAWTKSAAGSANWVDVSQIPPVIGTNYVSSSTPGQIDAYKIQTQSNITSVQAVQVSMYANKTDTGARSISPGLGNGSTQMFSTAVSQLTSPKYYMTPYDINPFTSSSWLLADLTSLQVCIKEQS